MACAITLAGCASSGAQPGSGGLAGPAVRLSPSQVNRIGMKIWGLECGGTVEGLTSWNKGEDFASLGIGHFIWYPVGRRGPFEESFPPLVAWLQARGVAVPAWLKPDMPCPWPDRASFVSDSGSARQRDLRTLLSATVGLQTEFIIARMQRSLPKMLAAAPAGRSAEVDARFHSLLTTPEGAFAMIDYVNFKGEGTNPTERYRGQGWGLLQVLLGMKGGTPADFSRSARDVLTRRVENSPPERGERRWLAGWLNRCDTYARPL